MVANGGKGHQKNKEQVWWYTYQEPWYLRAKAGESLQVQGQPTLCSEFLNPGQTEKISLSFSLSLSKNNIQKGISKQTRKKIKVAKTNVINNPPSLLCTGQLLLDKGTPWNETTRAFFNPKASLMSFVSSLTPQLFIGKLQKENKSTELH